MPFVIHNGSRMLSPDDACTSVFSQQQVARMHCYADLFYGSWQPGAGSSRIPEPPMAPVPVASGPHSVTLSWAPSVASVQKDQCSLCTETRALSQYAIRATDGANHRDAWEPRQATGKSVKKESLSRYKLKDAPFQLFLRCF